MKKKITLDLNEDKSLVARRRSRQAIGTVKPQRVLEPGPKKSPKHKKRLDEDEFRGQGG